MEYFQITAFLLEIVVLIIIITIGLLISLSFIKDRKSWIKSENKFKKAGEVILRIAFALLLIYWAKISLLTRIMDLPYLLTGKFSTVDDFAMVYRNGSKDLFEHVQVGQTDISFFYTSGAENYNNYKIIYLPNSKHGINVEHSSNYPYAKIEEEGLNLITFGIITIISSAIVMWVLLKTCLDYFRYL